MGAGFDRVAGPYQVLEYLAFGRSLERARAHGLDRLRDCREILVIGEGDGRCLRALVRVAPAARIRCIDASAAMIARARRRLASSGAGDRVAFEHADVRDVDVPAARYDAVVTMFVLDCFSPSDVAAIAARLVRGLRPGGRWVFADFAIPPRGWARLRARVWVRALYAFFGWSAGLSVRALPPSEAILQAAGLTPVGARAFQHGLVRNVLFAEATHHAAPCP